MASARRARQAVLGEMGAERGATALDAEGQLVVARPEAVYFYTPDGRGPCFVFEGAAPGGSSCDRESRG